MRNNHPFIDESFTDCNNHLILDEKCEVKNHPLLEFDYT